LKNIASRLSNIQDIGTKKKADSSPPEGCALSLFSLVERPTLGATASCNHFDLGAAS